MAEAREEDDIVGEEEQVAPVLGVARVVWVGRRDFSREQEDGAEWIGDATIGDVRAEGRSQRFEERFKMRGQKFPVYVQDEGDEEEFERLG